MQRCPHEMFLSLRAVSVVTRLMLPATLPARPKEGRTMSDIITVRGIVGTDINSGSTKNGWPAAEFRLVSKERRQDQETGQWVDAASNWYTVKTYRYLAQNVGSSLHKGDPVVVTGKLKLRQWSSDDGRHGTAPEIEADGIGHDLKWGTSNFVKSNKGRYGSSQEPAQVSNGGNFEGMAPDEEVPENVSAATGEVYPWTAEPSLSGQALHQDEARGEPEIDADPDELRMAG